MPVINRVAELKDEVTEWRRDFHENPELMYDVERTAGKVAEFLKEFGVDEIVTGVGRTGVVGVIKGRKNTSGKTIALRADMDALPIVEATGKPYASKNAGKMHACGHDGHTAMLLGTAKYLTETRNFDGDVVLVFQPAEEGGAGGKAMVDDGMMDRFAIDEIYGLHNFPGIEVGKFASRTGALLAAVDIFDISITGKGGHAAKPHGCIDPIVAGSAIVQALQTFVSRNADPLDPVVVSVTKFQGGETHNVIPQTVELAGTVRSMDRLVGDHAEVRLHEIITQVASAYGCMVEINYIRNYPPTVNPEKQVTFAGDVAKIVVGEGNVDMDIAPVMGGEDFSFLLDARPGAFFFMGNGDSAGLHHPEYDFNDDAIPYGISFFAEIIHKALPVE